VRGTGVATDLVRILRQLKQVRDRLARIEQEIASLGESDIAILQAEAEDAGKKGRDPLAEMAANVQGRINTARQYESEAARMKAAR
jgi:cell division septum initiation protein DivIVA